MNQLIVTALLVTIILVLGFAVWRLLVNARLAQKKTSAIVDEVHCDLVISNIASDSTDFTVGGTLSFPLTIHAGGSLAVPIRFHPSSLGTKVGNITVSSNDPLAATKMRRARPCPSALGSSATD